MNIAILLFYVTIILCIKIHFLWSYILWFLYQTDFELHVAYFFSGMHSKYWGTKHSIFTKGFLKQIQLDLRALGALNCKKIRTHS